MMRMTLCTEMVMSSQHSLLMKFAFKVSRSARSSQERHNRKKCSTNDAASALSASVQLLLKNTDT